MCIAIYKPAGKTISKAVLDKCQENNPDGCGLAYVNKKGVIEVKKSMSYKSFYKTLRSVEKKNPKSDLMIHFRVRTKGNTDLSNCHPFRVNDHQVFMHNGTIYKAPNCTKGKRSDTQMFNEEVLKDLPLGWQKSKYCMKWVEDYIGTGSKLIVMNTDGSVQIANESKGHWEDDIWWSNYSHRCLDTYSKSTGNKIQKTQQRQHNNSNFDTSDRSIRSTVRTVFFNPNKSKNSLRQSTLPIHSHNNLEVAMMDEFLREHSEDTNAFVQCSVCGGNEHPHLVTGVRQHNVSDVVCRKCLYILDESGMFYYETESMTDIEAYSFYFPKDDISQVMNIAGYSSTDNSTHYVDDDICH